LRSNYRAIRAHLPAEVEICCVVKCDGYGHGVISCAQTLEQSGAKWLGVTSTEEGVAVRQAGVRANILVMTGFWRGEEEAVLQHDLTPAIATAEHVAALERAALLVDREAKSVPVHLKIDTGMSRFGVAISDLAKLAERIKRSPYLVLDGVFSHLASSEILDAADAKRQVARYQEALAILSSLDLLPPHRHLSNTAAIQARPEAWNNMVRPGLALYGYGFDFPGHAEAELALRPVLSWKTRIVGLREIAAGTAVGYNGRFVADKPTKVGLIAVGYGDGFSRQLSCRGRVIVRDRYAPILGAVSMDMTTIDLSAHEGVEIGDEVTLIGATPSCEILATEHAKLANTIPYEILCGLSPRVPRVYLED